MKDKEPNHYDRLGVSSSASYDEIRAAYVTAQSELLPGKDKEAIEALKEAFNTLKDKDKRDAYDKRLEEEKEKEAEGPSVGTPSQDMEELMKRFRKAEKGSKELSDVLKDLKDSPNVKPIKFDDKGMARVDDEKTGVSFGLKRGKDGKYSLEGPLKGNFTLMLPSADGKGMDAIVVKDGKVVDGVFKGGSSKERDIAGVKASVERTSSLGKKVEDMTKDPRLASSPKPGPTPKVSSQGVARGK